MIWTLLDPLVIFFFRQKVHIVADAVSSRTQIDRRLALERMRGIFVVFLIT